MDEYNTNKYLHPNFHAMCIVTLMAATWVMLFLIVYLLWEIPWKRKGNNDTERRQTQDPYPYGNVNPYPQNKKKNNPNQKFVITVKTCRSLQSYPP